MTDDWTKVEMEGGETWDFETTKELMGVLTEKEEKVGPNESMMYKVQKTDGATIGVWGNTVLDARMKKINIGDEIKLVYLGKALSPKTGREYHNFDVYHRQTPMSKVE
jgi:hypothetical protein